ncbi:PREDICTED: trypsin-like [Gekko japonicus]|uniref:Trypsin-like n=1 Tax=Gekko japonicus TaxID=146911 RepID=A0ABM1L3I3_GEKJA|nr:PREDICTED: trypsin-like [Gekko japonicus]
MVSAQKRIIGGADCHPHSQPWQVFLYDSFQNYCGGVLINKYWVVTAGHCHEWQDSGPVGRNDNGFRRTITVFLGAHTLWKRGGAQITHAVEAIRHAAFEPMSLKNDIMLLRLDPPAVLGGRVRPIPMAGWCAPVGTKCVVSGWGATSIPEVKYTRNLQCVEVMVLPKTVCRNAYGANFINSEICAGAIKGGRDACQGDSGGALVCNGVLHGLVSWGDERCAVENRPGVYTEICKFRGWIIRNMID